MRKKRVLVVLLIAFSVFFGACSKSDTGKSSINTVENSVVTNGNTIETDKKSGGQITIIAGADKGLIKMRSTRFH